MEIAPIGTPARRVQDLEMMKSPDRWPMWPKLPIKKPGSWDDKSHGYLINTSLKDDKVEPKVYLATIFEVHNSDKFQEYANLEALLDDGWTVD